MATRAQPRSRAGEVAKALRALSSHADLIARAMQGNIEVGQDEGVVRAVDALASVNALRPYEEGVYRLNPRLHEFLADFLVSYNTNQVLTRLSPLIEQGRAQFREMEQLHKEGSDDEFERIQWAFDSTVAEISYAIERNQLLLNAKASTSVDNLEAKLRENAFYAKEIAASLRDMEKVASMATDLAERALAAGLPRMRQLLRQRLASQLLRWRTLLADIQSRISEWLFHVQRMERRKARLARAALWLQQNRTRLAMDVDVGPDAPAALFRPEGLRIAPQLDVRTSTLAVTQRLADLVGKLPPAPQRRREAQADLGPQRVICEENEVVRQEPLVEHRLLRHLQRELDKGGAAISLRDWKARNAPDWEASDAGWLFYAAAQLRAKKYHVAIVWMPDADPAPLNEQFYDYLAQGVRRVAGSAP